MALPVVDVGPLIEGGPPRQAARQIADACRDTGFFYVAGHGVPADLLARLDAASRRFFALPEAEKMQIAMARGGRAWRGYFPLGAELTAGRPDRKEGLYFGTELPQDHPRVRAGLPLHGGNLFPAGVPELRPAVLAYLDALGAVAQAVLRGVALGLDLDAEYFAAGYTAHPTVLFRIFHYPPATSVPAPPSSTPADPGRSPPEPDDWGVGAHTDYGLLTLLAQDDNGGLQVRTPDGWVDAPPIPGTFVCNIGDMLHQLTGGRYRSTVHRVRNVSGRNRLSYPFFFDPDFTAPVRPLPGRELPDAFKGTYGDYLLAKVGKVFPELGRAVL